MEIIRDHLQEPAPGEARVPLFVERMVLAKRRWRALAEDGREFGFDLVRPLDDGDAFFRADGAVYVLAQKPEPVLEIFTGTAPGRAAQLGWMIGNLHFPLAIETDVLRVPDDPALRQLFERENVPFTACEAVFKPIRAAHSHSHSAPDDAHHHH
jgi:urease accessory protein